MSEPDVPFQPWSTEVHSTPPVRVVPVARATHRKIALTNTTVALEPDQLDQIRELEAGASPTRNGACEVLGREIRGWVADHLVWWAFRLDPDRFVRNGGFLVDLRNANPEEPS